LIIYELSNEECHQFLIDTGFGRLGCCRDKQPYVVPIYFASDKKHLYGFTTLGKKVNWMRLNPLVCVQTDQVIDCLNWKSVIVSGRFQELKDGSRLANVREYALELLQRRVMWWQPAGASSQRRNSDAKMSPIFYRIRIDEITGQECRPDSVEEATRRMGGEYRALNKGKIGQTQRAKQN